MAEQEPVQLNLSLPVVFLDADEHTYQLANVFVLSVNPDGCHLTIGQVQLPTLC